MIAWRDTKPPIEEGSARYDRRPRLLGGEVMSAPERCVACEESYREVSRPGGWYSEPRDIERHHARIAAIQIRLERAERLIAAYSQVLLDCEHRANRPDKEICDYIRGVARTAGPKEEL